MTMTEPNLDREERRREQKVIADSLKASGALDDISLVSTPASP